MTSQYVRYTPFDKDLDDVLPEELDTLLEVHEGWYVEYKSEAPNNRALAKSLSAFANQYGGILFIGIATHNNSTVPGSFPGILNSTVDATLEQLRNCSKDLLNPPVFFATRIFEGPISSIGLRQGYSIIAVRIPQGPDTPYIHNDGRIYRRIADASDPTHETDRATLDLLHDRRNQAYSRLENRILQTPSVSRGEENQPYIHLNILSDPYEIMGHSFPSRMPQFTEVMKGIGIPFDNIYRSHEGFVSRQIGGNDPYNRLLTWEFSRHCHSLITLPVNVISRRGNHSASLELFLSRCDEMGLGAARILDLNQLLPLALQMVIRHRILAKQANVNGPFYVKIHIENVWRTIPFIDLDGYFQNTVEYGFPLVQDTNLVVPTAGGALNTFISLAERDISSEVRPDGTINGDNMSGILQDAAKISSHIFMALGISPDLIPDIGDLVVRNMNIRTAAPV